MIRDQNRLVGSFPHREVKSWSIALFLLLPGATVPAIGVELGNRHGGRRLVHLDPMTGFPNVESVIKK